MSDASEVGLGFWSLGAKVRDGPGLFFVEGENFDAALGGDSERGVEHIDAVAFGWDIEFVIVAEEFCLRASGLEEAGPAGRRFL